MTYLELFLIAVGLSMDAFAVSICKGLSVRQLKPRHAMIAGGYFGGFQALMPVIGWLLGRQFESLIKSITGDKDLMASFAKDPVGTLEKKLGIDLPDEQINQLIKMIKEKLGDAGTKTLLQKIKSFFGK